MKNLISYTVLGIAFIFMIYFLFLLYYPFQIMEYNSFTTDKKNYTAGEDVIITVNFCKYQNYPAKISSQLIDGFLINTPELSSNVDIGCHKFNKIFTIPDFVGSGDDYYIKETVTYDLGIREVSYSVQTEQFTVRGNK